MTEPTGELKKLFDKLDKEATAMLTGLQRLKSDEPDDSGSILGFIERARVFSEVSKYAFERARMQPAKPVAKQGKFNALRQQFHGNGDQDEGGTPKPQKPGPKPRLKSVG